MDMEELQIMKDSLERKEGCYYFSESEGDQKCGDPCESWRKEGGLDNRGSGRRYSLAARKEDPKTNESYP